jgi:hypothetical protein
MISKTLVQPVSTNDPRLQFVIDCAKDGCKIFVEAIRASTDEQVEISFKAFTLSSEKKEEVDSVFEIIMTAVAIELKEIAEDLIEKWTFYNSQEETDDSEYVLLLHCRKEKAPVPEPKVVEIEEEEEKEENEVVLPHPSVMSAYSRPGCE